MFLTMLVFHTQVHKTIHNNFFGSFNFVKLSVTKHVFINSFLQSFFLLFFFKLISGATTSIIITGVWGVYYHLSGKISLLYEGVKMANACVLQGFFFLLNIYCVSNFSAIQHSDFFCLLVRPYQIFPVTVLYSLCCRKML